MPITRETDAARVGDPNVEIVETPYGPRYLETLYAGQVVGTGSTYLGDGESTYWATIAEPDGSFSQAWYGSDRNRLGSAEIDAPPAVMALWTAELERRRAAAEAERRAAEAERERREAELRARTPRRGSFVRVVRGRKVPLGKEGAVFWSGESAWGPRIGVDFGDTGREFISAENVEVLRQPAD